jgi:hypothetical protein
MDQAEAAHHALILINRSAIFGLPAGPTPTLAYLIADSGPRARHISTAVACRLPYD